MSGSGASGKPAPPLGGVLETAVYVDDLAVASAFYVRLLGREPMVRQARLHAFEVAPAETLLLFPRALSKDDAVTPFGTVPAHYANGPAHFAFRIAAEQYEPWRQWLAAEGLAVISEVNWPQGGHSLYFNDPDGNVLEVATPGLWPNYKLGSGEH